MDIKEEIDKANKFVKKANKFIDKIYDELGCEICYTSIKSCSFKCEKHQVCKNCFSKIDICPFCRAQKKGVYPDLWFYNDNIKDWVILNDEFIKSGIHPDFFSFHSNYLDFFRTAITIAIDEIKSIPIGNANRNKSIVRLILSYVNCKVNFPVFVFKDKTNISYDSNRWKQIEQSILERLGNENINENKKTIRNYIGMLICCIKEVSPKLGLIMTPMI